MPAFPHGLIPGRSPRVSHRHQLQTYSVFPCGSSSSHPDSVALCRPSGISVIANHSILPRPTTLPHHTCVFALTDTLHFHTQMQRQIKRKMAPDNNISTDTMNALTAVTVDAHCCHGIWHRYREPASSPLLRQGLLY